MRYGGGVLCLALLQLVVGLCILGIYEKYKKAWYRQFAEEAEEGDVNKLAYVDGTTPSDYLFYISIFNNVFSIFGLAGIIHSLKELVLAFFFFNAIQTVVAFHYFVDVVANLSLRGGIWETEHKMESSAAAFMFFNFALSLVAATFAVKAVDEIKVRQREEYNRLAVLSDNLQYEADNDKP
ncbi:unnamed protein product [Ostreobium quekettii]|uniref:Uncharacterized protein n=1 Tax=Ostreobium quekettii TaxID=121088 RepID=A0A8S1JFD7_9CHLO|nr:unnamed protein product [Ostreobium quekettii]|eukprot:evm.model.scf_846.2 EVM.evm.TU.scf_846.2   scf_846:58429-62485(-)